MGNMLPYDSFVAQAAKIPYQYRHPLILYALVKWLRPLAVVEVGTHLGMSAVWMARALQENGEGKLYCIDSFCWVEEDQENLWNAAIDSCGVRGCVQLIKGRSQEVQWPSRIDMAYIDGNHTFDVCLYDALKAYQLGARTIVLHDTVSWEGSRKCSDHIRQRWMNWDFLEVNFEEGLLIANQRELKGPCRGFDIGEKWDKPKADV